jgi:hypothetical protein
MATGLTLEQHTYEHGGRLDWAALESPHAQLTLARAGDPIERDKQVILFYLYTDDLAALREQLRAQGVPVGERAYDPGCARLTLTRRQIPASLPAHARTRASAVLPAY